MESGCGNDQDSRLPAIASDHFVCHSFPKRHLGAGTGSLTHTIRERYDQASNGDPCRIFDEFLAYTGCHRKHATGELAVSHPKPARPPGNRVYDEAVRQALIVLCEASERVCGKRLETLISILVGAGQPAL